MCRAAQMSLPAAGARPCVDYSACVPSSVRTYHVRFGEVKEDGISLPLQLLWKPMLLNIAMRHADHAAQSICCTKMEGGAASHDRVHVHGGKGRMMCAAKWYAAT